MSSSARAWRRHLLGVAREEGVHRVIVAMPDRRGNASGGGIARSAPGGSQGGRSSFVAGEDFRKDRSGSALSELADLRGWIPVQRFFPAGAQGAEFPVALVGLLLALPLMPFIVLAVRLDSAGPVLYRQKRVGRRGEIFYCYKFRTMRQDAEADTGATWATDDDPRITRVGKFLRASRLDEIPQLWCVLKGDMHFVGPRPERPEFVEWLSKEIPYYGVRHVVRPGITGWAQVQYKYGNTREDAREKLQYDLFYIKNASLGLDLLIMFQTIKIVLLGRGAQ